ncbi:unnamed protein product [marine sediment metagenome]|uniref:Uncharacterized protein n=1 Tax=marine sediment metagenome TaxID=412755 RepID=X1A7J9_9ZZZZ
MYEDKKANRVLVANIPMPVADKEYVWSLPKGCKWFTLHVRDATAARIAFKTGHVANSVEPYFTLKANTSWDEKYLEVDISRGLPVFFACAGAGKVVEVVLGVYDDNLEGME